MHSLLFNPHQELKLYPRPDGRFGVRNHLAVVSTVFCANHVVERICREVPGAVPVTHLGGCAQLGRDAEQTRRILLQTGKHPNVGGVLYVGLGCEQNSAHEFCRLVGESGKPARSLVIQEAGGTRSSIEQGREACAFLQQHMDDRVQVVSLSALTVGIECGGSDFSSGIVANPAVGLVADALVDAGATVIFGETCEVVGAEHLLAERALDDEVRRFLLERVRDVEQEAQSMKVDIRGSQPSPGNIEGGLSSIEEKSLGAICKSGSRRIVGGLDYGQEAVRPGLHFMDCPGQDLTSICGLVTGGAHLVLFTTGRGSPLGFAIAPVLKITANSHTARMMSDDMDVDLSGYMDGAASLEEAAALIAGQLLQVLGGTPSRAEALEHREFGFHSIGPTL